MDEPSLLERARRLESQALIQIYDLYSDELYRYAVRLSGDPDLAEECVAETFTRLLETFRRGGGPHQFLRAYLYRIAHNWLTDQFRTSRMNVSLDAAVPLVAADDPALEAEMRLRQQAVREALFRLTPDQRQVILLRYVEGWGLEEVARALQKPVGAVKALQHRAVARLRRLLNDIRMDER
ncbi:MAG: sigma-70 family RNA polymerase sigma factor [Thermoflexia bacterium]|nr:MAG: sigma-70 family RNA polymerase sigma factor [Thermoflexia bacterium]